MKKLTFRTLLKKSAAEVIGWHLRESSLQRSTPAWTKVSFSTNSGKPDQLGIIECRGQVGPIGIKALYRYKEFHEKECFSVVQIRGVLKYFELVSRVKDLESRGCELTETVQYVLPWYLKWIDIQGRLVRIFRYKHALIERDLDIFERYPFQNPLKILVTGSHGLVGSQLIPFLECAGHSVYRLIRSKREEGARAIYWNPETKEIDLARLEAFDAVIHLAGDSIGKGAWTKKKKEKILNSRSGATDFLTKSLATLSKPPKVFLCASAMGYYGETGQERVDEEARPRGDFFLSQVCRLWEESCLSIKSRGVRVINMRFGLVLSGYGGILKSILPLFKFGLGGRLGHGRQYMSWIAIDDLLAAIYHFLMTSGLEGPFNLASPHSVTNEQFTKELASVLGRWTGPPMPAFLVRLLFGQKGEEMLLNSIRLDSKKLVDSGYFFRYPSLKQALEHVL